MSKKIASIGLSVTTMVWLLGGVLPVQAATAADIQAQINALMAQIQALQSQLGVSSGGTTSYNYTRDLTVGSKGADVTALQNFLAGQASAQWPSGQAATGYFGNVTKAAVAKFQAAVGLTPAVGYFGPKTRAYVASLAAGGTSTGGTGGGTVVAPASGLAVSYAANNPVGAATFINGAARIPVLALNYTAGNSGAVTLTGVKFTKTGVVSDSSISGAYLVRSGQVLAQYNSLSSGVLTFSGLSISIPAGQTQTLWLAVDTSGATAGNTVAFKVAQAADITAVDYNNTALTPTGSFPVQSVTFTASTVSNPSLAGLTITSSSVGATVYAGNQGVLVSQWTANVTNSKVYLNSVNFRVIGSAAKSDLKNVKLYVNGTQVGNTLASVSADGFAYFDLTSSPAALGTGNSNLQVYADVAGSPSFNFQFELLNGYDVYALDSQYNVPVSVTITGGTGTQITIQPGQLTVSLATDSPTGNVAKGQAGVTIAKFSIFAAGEAVKVKFLDFTIALASTATILDASLPNEIKNVSLIDDQGGQVGSTINTPPTTNSCASDSTPGITGNTNVYKDCFGTSASPINYTIPANTTRVLSLKADITNTADFTSITGALAGNSSNLQGLTSAQLNNTGAVTASALSLAANALTVATNTAVGTQTVTKNSQGVRIGSYAFTASTAEGVSISNVTITSAAAASTNMANLKVKVGSTQFGTTYPTLSNSTAYTFSGTPFTVPAGQSVILDVYADILSGASMNAQGSTLSACTGTGSVSYASISCATAPNGQTVTVGSAAALTVSVDSGSTASVGQLVMGTTQNPLATFRFTETSNNEDVKITDLNVFQSVGTTTNRTSKSAFGNLTLYQGSTPVGTGGAAVTSGNVSGTAGGGLGYYYKFHFNTPIVIPKAQSVSLTLKGDVSSYASNGADDNSTSTFRIVSSTDSDNIVSSSIVVALGNTSNVVVPVTLSGASGNTQTILRSNVLVSASPLGVTSGRAKNTVDDLGTLTFTASNGGAIAVNGVRLTLAGTLPTTTFTTAADLKLYDPSTGTTVSSTLTTSSCASGSTCTFNFFLGTGANGYQLSAGASKTFNVRSDTFTHVTAGSNGVSLTFAAQIAGANDVSSTDAIDGTGVTVSLPATAVPITINSASFAAGS